MLAFEMHVLLCYFEGQFYNFEKYGDQLAKIENYLGLIYNFFENFKNQFYNFEIYGDQLVKFKIITLTNLTFKFYRLLKKKLKFFNFIWHNY